jgi:hypothetical protein
LQLEVGQWHLLLVPEAEVLVLAENAQDTRELLDPGHNLDLIQKGAVHLAVVHLGAVRLEVVRLWAVRLGVERLGAVRLKGQQE